MAVEDDRLAPAFIHPTSTAAPSARFGPGVQVWQDCLIFDDVEVGRLTRIGSRSVLGAGTRIGERCKIQNEVLVFGATIEDEVFLAPRVSIVEDPTPRATTVTGGLIGAADWVRAPVRVERGASIGVGSVVLPGVTIGAWAMVAGGSVCAKSVPTYGVVAGNPARLVGHVCRCGRRLDEALGCVCGLRYEREHGVELRPITHPRAGR